MHSYAGYMEYLLSGKVLDELFVMTVMSALEQLHSKPNCRRNRPLIWCFIHIHKKRQFVFKCCFSAELLQIHHKNVPTEQKSPSSVLTLDKSESLNGNDFAVLCLEDVKSLLIMK